VDEVCKAEGFDVVRVSSDRGKMIVALPCIHFTVKEREIIRKYGFMTFPEFVDNHYVKSRHAQVSYLVRCIKKYDVVFAIAPDYQYRNALLLRRLYPDIEWIFIR